MADSVEDVGEGEGGSTRLIAVKTLTGKTYMLEVMSATSVATVKEMLAVEAGIPVSEQTLIYCRRQCDNDMTVGELSSGNETVFHLVFRKVTPPPPNGTTG